jgi:hypothetical protein
LGPEAKDTDEVVCIFLVENQLIEVVNKDQPCCFAEGAIGVRC